MQVQTEIPVRSGAELAEEIRTRASRDPEMKAIAQVLKAVDALDVAARRRVLEYVYARVQGTRPPFADNRLT